MSNPIKLPAGFVLCFYALTIFSAGCRKDAAVAKTSTEASANLRTEAAEIKVAAAALPNVTGYTLYTIKKGQHDASPRPFKTVSITEQKFSVVFDSSCIYTSTTPSNQADINKLYGFSDNNGLHQSYSARWGWRWYNNKLSLQAYVYNKGSWTYADVGTIAIGTIHTCSIKVQKGSYLFTLNNTIKVTMPRAATTTKGTGYQLYPYFGGDEVAKKDVKIWIKPA
jgi:hypothetical protein